MHPLVLGRFSRGSNDATHSSSGFRGTIISKMVLHNRNLNNGLKSCLFNKNTLNLHL